MDFNQLVQIHLENKRNGYQSAGPNTPEKFKFSERFVKSLNA